MLTFGTNRSFSNFKEKIKDTCIEKYRYFGRLFSDDKYYMPPKPKKDDYISGTTDTLEKLAK